MAKRSELELRKQLGATARELDHELSEFRAAAAVLSSSHPRLVDEYAEQWVGVYRGRVEASGDTVGALMRQLASKNIPTDKVLVRYIDRTQRTMIL